MSPRTMKFVAWTFSAVFLSATLAGSTLAQNEPSKPRNVLQGLEGLNGLGPLAGSNQITLSAQFTTAEGERPAILYVTAQMAPGWHVYSLTQAAGGPIKSSIKLDPSEHYKLAGEFRPDHAPEIRKVEFFKVPIEEHYGTVTWGAPIELGPGVDPAKVAISGRLEGQVCHDSGGCVPLDGSLQAPKTSFTARLAPLKWIPPVLLEPPPAAKAEYRAANSHATLRGYIAPVPGAADGRLRVVIEAQLEPAWHIYAFAPTDPEQLGSKPTLIAIDQPAGATMTAPTVAPEPILKKSTVPAVSDSLYHEELVRWTFEVTSPPGSLGEVSGLIGYQTCRTSCDRPAGARFHATLSREGPSPLLFTPASYDEAAKLAAWEPLEAPNEVAVPSAPQVEEGFDPTKVVVKNDADQLSLPVVIGLAFVGGFILNFMPCVLPVIGLKVMSFVNQSGESRAKVFALNVWYTLGLLSIFMVLATLAAVFNLGWGEQFNFDRFNIPMVAVVFVMALSFLGVWEIPIPGFAGSGTAMELAEKEGPVGAFAKGMVTTVLATPCSGPGLATALAWSTGKPAYIVYALFACMGLGMALPYLVIGANPKLIRFIPKPGQWMITFKHVMGFVLLATVIYLLSFIRWPNVVPTLALMFGLWAACWWIGQVPITAEFGQRARAWIAATIIAVATGLVAFGGEVSLGGSTFHGLRGMMEHRFLAAVDRAIGERNQQLAGSLETAKPSTLSMAHTSTSQNQLPWQPFSSEKLKQLTAQKQTVLIDFTADWCLTCKALEATVLNTHDVRKVVDENRIVTLVADWTDRNPEIDDMMQVLGSKQVPVLAIFPADRPNEPIVIQGGYTKNSLIKKLRDAGPSRSAPAGETTAMSGE